MDSSLITAMADIYSRVYAAERSKSATETYSLVLAKRAVNDFLEAFQPVIFQLTK